nr:hypothetical protein [Tanacetum cinerariifolium]
MSTVKSKNRNVLPGRIRIAHRRRIPSGATTCASGNSDDGAIIAGGAGKMGAVGIYEVEVVGDTCLLGISVSNSELSKHKKGETIGATDTKVQRRLSDIKADATTVEVAVDRDVKAGIDIGIGMEVDVGIDVKEEVEDEVESNDRGTIEVRVDMGVGIDISDALAAYEATRATNALEAENQSQNSSDGDNGNGGNKNRKNGNGEDENVKNGNPNENNRDARPDVRECMYQDFMKCQLPNFKETKGVVGLTRWFENMETMFHISNCPEKYQVKYATCTLLNSALT